uniref:Coiled-coil domain-containing protein 24 n=1 Tax=Neogobius melanostomus TaxID=47308 RepID=A0A8C6WWY3_9GOBI
MQPDRDPLLGRHRSSLADPPAVKELVRAEVRMLLQTLRERAGRNENELLSLYKPETVSYALRHASRCHNSLPEGSDLRSASRLSLQSNAEVEIEAVRENLNSEDIDQVVDRLKSLFKEECEALKQEIKQLQRHIWRKIQQNLEPSEPTLGGKSFDQYFTLLLSSGEMLLKHLTFFLYFSLCADLKELRDVIQRDLVHYPVPYTSSVKELKRTHRLASATSHQPRVSIASSVQNNHPHLKHIPFTQPKPPIGLPPLRTSSSPRPMGISSRTFSIPDTREVELSQHNLHSTSLSGTSCPLIRQYDGNPSPGHQSPLCSIPANTYSFPIKPQKNSATHKTHNTSHGSINNKAKESNLSPQMDRRQSVGHGSRNTNIASSAISPCSYECNKDSQNNDCPGKRPQTPNGLQNTTSGNPLLPIHDGTGKSTGIPANKCEMGIAKGHKKEMDTNGSGYKDVEGVLYTKPKAHYSSSLKTQREKPEQTEYLNRFIQPVPPSRVK